MKLTQSFHVDRANGGLVLQYDVTDLGQTPSLHVRHTVIPGRVGLCPADSVAIMQRQLLSAIAHQLFGEGKL